MMTGSIDQRWGRGTEEASERSVYDKEHRNGDLIGNRYKIIGKIHPEGYDEDAMDLTGDPAPRQPAQFFAALLAQMNDNNWPSQAAPAARPPVARPVAPLAAPVRALAPIPPPPAPRAELSLSDRLGAMDLTDDAVPPPASQKKPPISDILAASYLTQMRIERNLPQPSQPVAPAGTPRPTAPQPGSQAVRPLTDRATALPPAGRGADK